MTAACAIAVVARLLCADAKPAEGETGYENPRCGLSLILPAGWTASEVDTRKEYDRPSCAIGLRPANWSHIRKKADCEAGPDAIYVFVYPGTLEQAAKREILFKEGGDWSVGGRGTRDPLERIKHPLGRAFWGLVELGCYGPGPHGHYERMANAEIAFVESGRRVVEISSDVNLTTGYFWSDFRAIMLSLRTIPIAPR